MLFATGGCKSMAHETQKTGVLDFVTNAAHERAAHYREHASQLRKMADKESAGRLRNNLLKHVFQVTEPILTVGR